jgi:hypothetical protein
MRNICFLLTLTLLPPLSFSSRPSPYLSILTSHSHSPSLLLLSPLSLSIYHLSHILPRTYDLTLLQEPDIVSSSTKRTLTTCFHRKLFTASLLKETIHKEARPTIIAAVSGGTKGCIKNKRPQTSRPISFLPLTAKVLAKKVGSEGYLYSSEVKVEDSHPNDIQITGAPSTSLSHFDIIDYVGRTKLHRAKVLIESGYKGVFAKRNEIHENIDGL